MNVELTSLMALLVFIRGVRLGLPARNERTLLRYREEGRDVSHDYSLII